MLYCIFFISSVTIEIWTLLFFLILCIKLVLFFLEPCRIFSLFPVFWNLIVGCLGCGLIYLLYRHSADPVTLKTHALQFWDIFLNYFLSFILEFCLLGTRTTSVLDLRVCCSGFLSLIVFTSFAGVLVCIPSVKFFISDYFFISLNIFLYSECFLGIIFLFLGCNHFSSSV